MSMTSYKHRRSSTSTENVPNIKENINDLFIVNIGLKLEDDWLAIKNTGSRTKVMASKQRTNEALIT